MSDAKAETKGTGRMPPYIPLSTLLTFIEELKANGIPPQIDNSVLKRFSGSVRTQLLSALKFLGLLSEDKKPAGLLPALVETYGDDAEFKKTLATVINSQFSFLGHMDLKTATPTTSATRSADRMRCWPSAVHSTYRPPSMSGSSLVSG